MIADRLNEVRSELKKGTRLVAISKYHPNAELMEAYDAGQRIMGESHVQELMGKYEALPKDIEWHFIGHLQTNKVKYIAPFIKLIHAVDTVKLLAEINKQAAKHERVIDCLLQIHIAQEETKYGFTPDELKATLQEGIIENMSNVRIAGLMCMATNTDDEEQIRSEFRLAHSIYTDVKNQYFKDSPYFKELSMGMSSDYMIAMQEGSTLIRVGSKIFGNRDYSTKFVNA